MTTTYVGLLVMALAGSLHCVGMCGPILVGFSQAFERAKLTVAGKPVARRWRTAAWEMTCYHAGRIWTYALLGLLAGWLGEGIRHGSDLMGWHRAAGVTISGAIILSGVMLLGVVPGVKLDALLSGCAFGKWGAARWFQMLLASRGMAPRLLLGAIMGFLPCGFVYGMLVVVATLPTPWHAALGMVVFGIGTLPALTAVLVTTRLVPVRLRANGTRLVAVILVLLGAWMMTRSLWVHDHGEHMDHDAHGPEHAAAAPPRASAAGRIATGPPACQTSRRRLT